MDHLTPEQQEELTTVLDKLAGLPTPELIVESARLRVPQSLDEIGKKRMHLAYAGAYAYEKITYYLETLRDIDQRRIDLNAEIRSLLDHADQLEQTNPMATVEPKIRATYLSGMLEVTFHLFASCVAQIERLLPTVSRAAGYKIPKTDSETMASYVPLRHHFEHLDERLPGRTNQQEFVIESQDERHWRVEIGFEIDNQSRIVIDGKAIDVTTRGLRAIEDIFQRLWEPLRHSSLEEVRKHYQRNPGDIVGPSRIAQRLLMSVNDKAQPFPTTVASDD